MQTLVVRDEVDVVDAQIAYHLGAGVDFVIATDHESRDGTTEVLERYVRGGYLRRIPVDGPVREADWRTTMARLAAVEYGADWVINTDADEFWMPRDGSLSEVFGAVPADYGVVWALTRHFLPRPDGPGLFAERMTARASLTAPLNDPTTPYRPHAKAAHRGDARIRVRHGAHLVHTTMLPLHNWHPADVLHFPFRSLAQYERKGRRRAHGDSPLGQYVKAYHASEAGRIDSTYSGLALADEAVARGVTAGSIVVDTRLRDALRLLQGEVKTGAGTSARSTGAEVPIAGRGRTSDERSRDVAEAAALRDADLVRFARQLDGLETRATAVARSRGIQAMLPAVAGRDTP